MPFTHRFIRRLRDERAFGIVEALMAMTIMSVVLIALLGLLIVSVKAVAASKLSTTATQIANQSLEKVRALPFDSVGIYGRDDGGTLTNETKTVTGVAFTVKYDVQWVDDSVDGIGAADVDADGPNDYKKVSVEVSWREKDAIQKVAASTFVRFRQAQTEPPTVNFIFGDLDYYKTPPDGTIFGTDDSPYKTWFDDGTIPLAATANDPDNGLVSMRFYIGGITPDGGMYGFDPTTNYTNSPICRWNPAAVDSDGDSVWTDGTHEVVVEVWDANGARDARSIHWVIDRYPPLWKAEEPANLTAEGLSHQAIRLSWQAAWDGSDRVTRYKVYRQDPGQMSFSQVADGSFPEMSFDDSGLSSWATYQYYLTAVSIGGRESTMTAGIATATTWFTITGTPFKSGSSYNVTVAWQTPPAGVTVDRYDIWRDGAYVGTAAGSASSYTDKGVARGTHTYEVKAYDGAGQMINRSIQVNVNV